MEDIADLSAFHSQAKKTDWRQMHALGFGTEIVVCQYCRADIHIFVEKTYVLLECSSLLHVWLNNCNDGN